MADSPARARPLVVGIGNPDRGDDAAGLLVARVLLDLGVGERADVLTHRGDGADLLDLWEGRSRAILVDAFEGLPPGRIVHIPDPARSPALLPERAASTHALGPAGAIALARRLGRLPARIELYAIAGARFGVGAPPHPDVAVAAGRLARRLARRLRGSAPSRTSFPEEDRP